MNRIPSLDVLRGFALCGILFVNAPAVLHLDREGSEVPRFLELVVHQRFFPIFALLFGVGFGLMWTRIANRAASPRVVMLRRIGALAVMGAAHQFLQPGEALLPYAIVAFALLIPATFLPAQRAARVAIPSGLALLAFSIVLGGGLISTPGLILLGFGIGCASVLYHLDRYREGIAIAAPIGIVLSAVAMIAQDHTDPTSAAADPVAAAAGIVMASSYILVILMLLNTPVASVLRSVFAPLGRMALTNYLAATLILIAAKHLVPWGNSAADWILMLELCVTILVLQMVASHLWLQRFGQGPLERAWRWLTWHGARVTA